MNKQPNSANLLQFTAYDKEDIALFEWVAKYTGYKVDSYSRYGNLFISFWIDLELFIMKPENSGKSIDLLRVCYETGFLRESMEWKGKNESCSFLMFEVNDLQRYSLIIILNFLLILFRRNIFRNLFAQILGCIVGKFDNSMKIFRIL